MTYPTHIKGAAVAALCALTLAACEGSINSPTSPSLLRGSVSGASNPDGTTLKVTAPNAAFPLNEATGVGIIPTLVAVPSRGRIPSTSLPHRFQVSPTNTFEEIVRTGTGTFDSQGIVRFVIDQALTTGAKYFWRVRAELEDQPGPWSAVMSFTTTGTTPPTTRPDVPGENRTANPPAGQILPLPDMRGVLAGFSNASDSCPNPNSKYILNAWLNRVIDRFRQQDTRWGYNAKPTRGPNDNGGQPVVVAGDEAAYNPTALADQGNTSPLLVDLLVGHCGSAPTIGWRVFTGEEPGIWTGAGRF